MKKRVLSIVIAILVLSSAFPYTALAVEEIPSTVVTTASDVMDEYDGVVSLSEAVWHAGRNGLPNTVTFSKDIDWKNVNIQLDAANTDNNYTIRITKNTVIDGENTGVTIISGLNKYIFKSEANSTLTLKNLNLRGNGTVPVNGGAIHAEGRLNLYGCNISGFKALGCGGAIYTVSGSELTAEDCIISGNTAGNDGGAIYSLGDMFINNCTIIDNIENGSAVYSAGTAYVFNSTIICRTAKNADEIISGFYQYGDEAYLCNSIITGYRDIGLLWSGEAVMNCYNCCYDYGASYDTIGSELTSNDDGTYPIKKGGDADGKGSLFGRVGNSFYRYNYTRTIWERMCGNEGEPNYTFEIDQADYGLTDGRVFDRAQNLDASGNKVFRTTRISDDLFDIGAFAFAALKQPKLKDIYLDEGCVCKYTVECDNNASCTHVVECAEDSSFSHDSIYNTDSFTQTGARSISVGENGKYLKIHSKSSDSEFLDSGSRVYQIALKQPKVNFAQYSSNGNRVSVDVVVPPMADRVIVEWSADTSFINGTLGSASCDVNPSAYSSETFVNLDLDNASRYFFRVIAVSTENNYAESVPSNMFQLYPSVILGTPSSLSVDAITDTAASLSWNYVAYATGYTVEWRKSSESTWNSTKVTGTTAVVDNLASETSYAFRVSAYDSSTTYMPSEPSSIVSADTHMCTPVTLSGPHILTVEYGYNAFTAKGYTLDGTESISVSKISGDEKISWNSAMNGFDIAAGLPVGSYKVTLRASNDTFEDYFTLTLTVEPASPEIVPDDNLYVQPITGMTLNAVPLPDGWVWADPQQSVDNGGTYIAQYTSQDSNYKSVSKAVTIVITSCKHEQWSEWVSDNNATFFRNGTKTRTCPDCGATETVIDVDSAGIYSSLGFFTIFLPILKLHQAITTAMANMK